MSYARVIVNPAAGAGRTRREWQQIQHWLKQSGLSYDHDITESPGHAIELARSAGAKGYEMVVSVGGDGTINEIVNGLHDSGNIRDITLGIISTGTGSDYVRGMSLPQHFRDACQRLSCPEKLLVDVGVAEYGDNGQRLKRLFVNFAGLGFDAEIARATTQRFKALGGKPSYLAGLLSTLLTYRNRRVTLTVDGQTEEKEICTVMVSKGKYAGGSMMVAPHADPADGFFDVLVIEGLSKADLIYSLPRIYRGTHLTHPRVRYKKAKEVSIRSDHQTFLQADGDVLGEIPVSFYILPAILNLAI